LIGIKIAQVVNKSPVLRVSHEERELEKYRLRASKPTIMGLKID
jgi:hypothetical protein